MAAILILTFILIGLGGRMLPTWMFINSMQLIMHTPLLATYMPSNLNYFLVKYLSIIRVASAQLDETIEAWQRERGVYNYELID